MRRDPTKYQYAGAPRKPDASSFEGVSAALETFGKPSQKRHWSFRGSTGISRKQKIADAEHRIKWLEAEIRRKANADHSG